MFKYLNTTTHVKNVIVAIISVMLAATCYAQLPGYSYYNILTIQSSQVAGGTPLNDFPVLIHHTDPDLATTANGGLVENGNGWDIRLTELDGITLLDQQLESYNPVTGEIAIWVRIPILSNSVDTDIKLFYGNSSVVTDPSTTAVWDTDYKGVWHLDNSNDDATNFANNLTTNNGTVNEPNSIIANGQQFTTGDYLSSGVEPELQINGDVTVETWINLDVNQGGLGDNTIISCGLPGLTSPENHQYKLNITGTNHLRTFWEFGAGTAETAISTIAAPLTISNWHHLAFTRDVSTNTVIFYFDGAQLGTPVVYVNDPNDGAASILTLGENFSGLDLEGSIDEPRVSDIIRSSEWLQTSYNSMSSPSTFYTISFRMSTAPDFCWAEDVLGTGNNEFLDLATDPSSGVSYAVGFFGSDVSSEFPMGLNNTPDMSSTLGNDDGLVAKYDTNGNPLWAFKIGAPGEHVRVTGVDIGANDHIFICGEFDESCQFAGVTGSPTQLLSGDREEGFIASYDSDGNLRWVRQGSNIGECFANDIAVNSTNVYITGWYENSLTWDGGSSMTSNDDRDTYVVGYDQATGNHVWEGFGGDIDPCCNVNDRGYAIAADDNNVFITGTFERTIEFNSNPGFQVTALSPGNRNTFLAQYNATTGAIEWADQISATGGSGNTEAHGLAVDASNLYVTGGVEGTVSFPGGGPTVTLGGTAGEVYACAIDRTTHSKIWHNIAENDDGTDVIGEDIIVDGMGNVYFTGPFRGLTQFNNGLDPINHDGGFDCFVTSLTTAGVYNWTAIASDGSNLQGYGLGYDSEGGVYVAGQVNNQATFPPLPILGDAGGEDAFVAKLTCTNPCPGPTITSCPPDLTVTADPTCNYTLGSYLGLTSATDDCATGSVVITQSPTPSTVLAAGTHTITMTATDGNGNKDQCTWELTIEADVNPVIVDCGQSYLNETTIGANDNGNSFTCAGSATPGEDVYYQITVPAGNYLLGITLENVSDANDSQVNTFWVGGSCPLGTGCLEENRYVLGSQKFISNNQNQLLFNAAGPGTYYFVVDSETDGVDNYDISFDCIVSGVEFDETGCGSDSNNDGIYTTIDGLPSTTLAPCDIGKTICNTVYVQNVNAGEWLDTVVMDLGNCYTNITTLSPDAPGPNGFYDAGGTWNATYSAGTNSIEWGFDYSGANAWGDGIGSNYNCLTYEFCFQADISPTCSQSTDLDISIHIEDDGVDGITPGVSNGFDDVVASFNLSDPPPTISCPANINVNTDGGSCSAIVNGIAPTTANDNCPVASITYTLSGATTGSGSNDASGETFNVGLTTVTYTVSDNIGQTANCSFTVLVSDNQNPNITCPSNISASNSTGTCTAIVNGIAPTSSGDNCSVASITYALSGATTGSGSNDASGETFNVGITTVTYTITDGAGNSTNCAFTVTVNDTENPSISCPGNVSTNNDLGSCSAIVNGIAPTGFSDNCSGTIVTYTFTGATTGSGSNDASGEAFNIGTTTVTYTATDASGNTSTCSFTVTVNDTQAPSISCPGDQNESTNASCQFTLPDYTTLATGLSDNCTAAGSIIVTQSPVIGTLISTNTTITLSADDGNGNTSTCTFDVLIDDTTPPTISCPADVVVSNTSGLCSALVNSIAPTASGDNCSVASITYALTGATIGSGNNDASGEIFNVGITTVTYTITDGAGNISSCAFTVTVNDTENPTISCPGNITQANDAGVCGAVLTFSVTSSDNCPGEVITQTAGLASGATFPIGTTTNTFLVTDASGNTATCSFDVIVNDTENPTISCPGNITQANDAGVCGAVITFSVTSTDNCPGEVITQTAGLASGATFPVGTTTNTFLVTDASGNTNTCSFDVIVNDTENPTITCPGNITQANDSGVCGAVVTFNVTSIDNCSGEVITQTAGLASGATFPVGATTNTFLVTDASGNTNTCSFDVIVNDTENPTITCPGNITQANDAGDCGAVVTFSVTSSDNCSGEVITQTAGLASGATFPIGTTTNTFLVTDASGNTATCSFDVIVNDTENPTITCPGNITQCDNIVTWTAPTSSDNCPGEAITQTAGLASGSTFPVGTTTNSFLVTDAAGNTNTCSFDVTILPPIDSYFWLPDTLCLNGAGNIDLDDSTNLDFSIPETDMFYSDSSQVQINPNNLFQPQTTGAGTYPITHVVDNGFCTDTTVLTVTILPDFQSNISPLDTVCAAIDTFNLVNLYNGSTDQGGEFFSLSGANIQQDTLWILTNTSGVQDIAYTIGPGICADTTFRQIYVSPNVDPSWQLPIDSLCVIGQPLDLLPFVTGTNDATSQFSGSGVLGNIFDPNNLTGQIVLTYFVGEGQCKESLNDTIFIVAKPIIDAGTDIEVCGDSALISGTSNTPLTWWSSSNDIAFTDSSVLVGSDAILLSNEGDYTIYLNADNGYCFIQDSLEVSYFSQPSIIDAGPNQDLDYTFSTYLDATNPDFGSGVWTYYNNSIINNINDPLSGVSNLEIGENVFYWVVTNGVCPSDSAYVTITVNDLLIPSGFSPNDDNKNDFFVIPGIENANSSTVQIFNRWGSEVFSVKNYQNNWNGQNMLGQDLANDTYYYVIKVDDREFSGYLIIRR